MKKKKYSFAAKAASESHEQDDVLADKLVELAEKLRDVDAYVTLSDPLRKAQADLRRIIRKCLQQQREPVLDEALERTYESDIKAYGVLRQEVEELSGTALFRREGESDLEVNAFVIPFFAHTTGGLRIEQCFQDETAFEKLRESMQEGGLESRRASVALVSYAYHPAEIERIGYCQLRAMVQEAFETLAGRKSAAIDAIVHSMRGWPPSDFAPQDTAMELRFLLGFAMKSMDDPFYHVPEKEAAADRYFEARAERFRNWSQQVTPLLARCLVTDGREVRIDYLYQDLFHGGIETALTERETLMALSGVQQKLMECGVPPDQASAVIGPAQTDDEPVVRICLHAASSEAPVGIVDKPLRRTEVVESAVVDLADGLTVIGLRNMQLARRIDADGVAMGARPYKP